MALTIRGRPIHFSLKWLKPPPTPPDGAMTLYEHLRELRYRLVVAALAISVGTIVAFVFNKMLFEILVFPYNRAINLAKQSRPDLKADLVIQGVSAPFTISLKVALLAGVIVTAPIWIYQIWAFIVPGLLAQEKKWTLIVVGAATPLFLMGVGLGYYVMPKAIAVLINFTPDSAIANLQDLGDFMSFMTRLMIVFGLAFEVPLFILMLNVTGVLPAKYISKYRSYIIFGMFVFAAIATPTPDALTMLLLAVPMVVLVVASEVMAHVLDRRKARRLVEAGDDVTLDQDKALAALSQSEPERSAIDAAPATADPPATNGYHAAEADDDTDDASAESLRRAIERNKPLAPTEPSQSADSTADGRP